MSTIKAVVAQNIIALLIRAAQYFGVSSTARNAVIQAFANALYGYFGDALAVSLFPLVYIYRLLNNVDVSLPQWITSGVSWLANTVRPSWNWLVNGVDDWRRWYANRANDIRDIARSVSGDVSDLSARIQWLWDNGYALIRSLTERAIEWVWGHLPSWARDGLEWLNRARSELQKLIAGGIDNLLEFARNPIQALWGLFPQKLRDAWQTLTDDLEYLVWLFTTAKRVLVQFITAPSEFIRVYVIASLLEWLTDAIVEAW